MKLKESDRGKKIVDFVGRKRNWLIGAAGTIAVYALLGFYLAPWLVKKNAVESVRETLGAELRLAKVAINPFALSLRIDGLELDDPRGFALARVQQIYVNFQLSSLFRWAWTFDEIRIDGPQVDFARDADGNLNIAFLAESGAADDDGEDESASADGAARLLVFDFAINESVVNWRDAVPADPVETHFGPVNIAIADLNTLPQRAGQQAVVITTETAGTLSWSGSLQLSPLLSEGHASIKGSHFPLTSAYIKHETGLDIVDGVADVELDYRVATRDNGEIQATVDNVELSFTDVLIKTFNAAFGIDESDREVLSLPKMSLSGGSLHWPDRMLSARTFAIDDALVSLYRNAAGRWNVLPNPEQPDEADPLPENADTEADDAWHVSLSEFQINRMALGLQDHFVNPPADIGYRSLDVSVKDISNVAGARFPTSIRMQARSEGRIALDGFVSVLPSPDIDLDLEVDGLALANAHPYLRPLADVNLDSGSLNVTAKLLVTADEPMLFSGDVEIVDFLITETDAGSRLGSWALLGADNVSVSAGKQSVEISEIRLDQAYGDILIAEDGSVNLGRAQKGTQSAGQDSETGAEASDAESEPATGAANVTVGRVVFVNASADFADQSLPLPFAAKIAGLNGEMSTIATASVEPSTVALEGSVDEYGLVRITGNITPLDPALNTDIKVVFENVEMPKFSAYTIPFAGREISSGRLDLDLGYKLTQSELVGENNVVLRDFELGEKVPHPDAMSLPLGLAVALLKDPEGKIDIDLPVRGNVDDPEFKVGGVIVQALVNLVVKIVASPFNLLANLIGAEASDLEYVNFIEGRSDLTPPEQERAAQLAEALALRPQLILEVRGVVDRDADGLAIKTLKLDQLVEERVTALAAGDASDAMYADQRMQALEGLYAESGIADEPSAALDALQVRFTSVPPAAADGETPEPVFDELAYASELHRQLVELQTVDEAEFVALARSRATNTRDAILAIDASLEPRIVIGQSRAVEKKNDEPVRMQVSLTAGESDSPASD